MCAITGHKMVLAINDKYKVSVDRIDSTKGYVEGNIQLVCWWVNKCKNDCTSNELINFAKGIMRVYGNKV